MALILVALLGVGLPLALGQPASPAGAAAAAKMMSRELTGADIDLYVRIASEIRKLTGPVRSGDDSDRILQITRDTAPKHGLSHAEYRALDLRIGAALLALDAGPKRAAGKMKADCDLVAKHRARIEAARKYPK
jgi:hypothetical protein